MTTTLSHPEAVALASDAGRKHREAVIADTWRAYGHDIRQAALAMPLHPDNITLDHVAIAREALTACQSHLNDIEVRLRAGARR